MLDQVKWDRRYLHLAQEVSRWSKDPSTKVGAVIVNSLGQVVGTGYNGFPRGVSDTDERYLDRDVKYKMICHAEQNEQQHPHKHATQRSILQCVW